MEEIKSVQEAHHLNNTSSGKFKEKGSVVLFAYHDLIKWYCTIDFILIIIFFL